MARANGHDPKLKRFLEYIRSNYCVQCGGCDRMDKHGEPRVTVSHVKTKGSGGTYYNNVIPHCLFCHHKWEISVKKNKQEMLDLAQEYTERFLREEAQRS